MTTEEKQMMQLTQEYIRKLQRFLFRERTTYELKLSRDYAGLGYAKTRSTFRYNNKGVLVETRYPVWTEKGQEFIKKLFKGKGQKDKKTNNSKTVKKWKQQ